MTDALVLITGATGHLGFKVLRTALEAGYHVRAAVRSEQKATLLKSNKVLKATSGFSNLSFIVIPDFLAPAPSTKQSKTPNTSSTSPHPSSPNSPKTTTTMPTSSSPPYKAP